MLLVERKEPTSMSPLNLLAELRQQDLTAALRQAEQVRLVRLARTHALPLQQHQGKTPWWRKTLAALKQGGERATCGCFSTTPCPGSLSCACVG